MASFEALQALTEIVTKNRVKHIQVIGNLGNADTKFEQFYDALATGRLKNDAEAAQYFYQTSPDHAAYRKLKDRMEDRLINTLFFIDINQADFNDYNRAYYTCYKEMNAVKILIGRFARKAAIPLAERTLKKAINFDLTDIVVLLAQELRTHYGSIEGNIKKFQEYDKIVEKYTHILLAEFKAESNYAQMRIHFAKAKGNKPEFAKDAHNFSIELRLLAKQYDSYKVKYFSFLTDAIYFEINNDYNSLLRVGIEALEYFDAKKQMVPITIIFSFSLRVLVSHIKLGNYKESWEIAPKCLSLAREGSSNWFLTLEYCIILSLHSRRFQEAYNHYRKAMGHSDFNKQYKGTSEHWRIHEAYIYYLISNQKITPGQDNPVKSFRLAKFVNEVPTYSKDKRGANISILILQILLLIQQRKYGEIIDRMESLKAYTQRYLRQDDTFRSNCFIQMLLTLPECSFHKKAILRKSEKYWKKLQEVPLHTANQSVEIEIVPYEMLWEFVLESLDEKWH